MARTKTRHAATAAAAIAALALAGGALLTAVPAVAATSVPTTPIYAIEDVGVAVEITLPGVDRPVLVHLDTGSSGLIIAGDAVDTSAMTATGVAFSQNYVGHSVLGEVYDAPVTIAGVTGAALPIGVEQSIECSSGDACWPFEGTVGTLGIGQGFTALGDSGVSLGSPLASIAGADGEGFTIDLQAEPEAAVGDALPQLGTLSLGRPYGSGTTELGSQKTGQTYPNGNPVFERRIPVAWSIGGSAPVSNVTTFDTGAPSGFVSGAPFAAFAADGYIVPGTSVTLAASVTAPEFTGWTVTSGAELTWTAEAQAGFDDFNSGFAFFLGRTMAWDAVDGHTKVGARAATPDTAPAQVAVDASDEDAVSVTWAKPASVVGLPHGGYRIRATPVTDAGAPLASVVAVRPAAAATESVVEVDALTRSATLAGLAPATTYDVSVVVFNAYGESPPATVRITTGATSALPAPSGRLAESGPGTPAGVLVLLSVVTIGAGAALLTRSRRRARSAR